VVSREEWPAARKQLLAKAKELTVARDRVNAERRHSSMVRIDKPYAFEGPDGRVSLLDLTAPGRPEDWKNVGTTGPPRPPGRLRQPAPPR
jgi:predicted dithiol-disulfide oxidoreductase (DUF899 family)